MSLDLISFALSGRILLVPHENSDVDSLGACIALQNAYAKVEIFKPDSMDRLASAMAHEFSPKFSQGEDDYDHVIAIDTSTPSMLPDNFKGEIDGVIDHHHDSGDWDVEKSFIDETFSSSCEMVFEILANEGKVIDRTIGKALLMGILADTSNFRYSNHETLFRAGTIVEKSGVSIGEVRDILEEQKQDDMSRRIARLKAAQRMRYITVGKWIIASSEVSVFESLAARSILSAGADVAFVGSQRKEKFRVSSRVRRELLEKGFHVGIILEEVSRIIGGEGGGHDGAAGLNGIGDVEHALNVCMDQSEKEIKRLVD